MSINYRSSSYHYQLLYRSNKNNSQWEMSQNLDSRNRTWKLKGGDSTSAQQRTFHIIEEGQGKKLCDEILLLSVTWTNNFIEKVKSLAYYFVKHLIILGLVPLHYILNIHHSSPSKVRPHYKRPSQSTPKMWYTYFLLNQWPEICWINSVKQTKLIE